MAGDHLSVNAFPGISSRDLASGPAGFKQHKFWQADLRSKLLLKGPRFRLALIAMETGGERRPSRSKHRRRS